MGDSDDRNEVLQHKTFHRYTVRAKRGTAQSVCDAQNRGHAPKSAGSALRRYNEAALTKANKTTDVCSILSSSKRMWQRKPSNQTKENAAALQVDQQEDEEEEEEDDDISVQMKMEYVTMTTLDLREHEIKPSKKQRKKRKEKKTEATEKEEKTMESE
ncbi:ankyrin repeat and zinc finger domain-containing protein 1 isoform X1, partial [Silurus asotus]